MTRQSKQRRSLKHIPDDPGDGQDSGNTLTEPLSVATYPMNSGAKFTPARTTIHIPSPKKKLNGSGPDQGSSTHSTNPSRETSADSDDDDGPVELDQAYIDDLMEKMLEGQPLKRKRYKPAECFLKERDIILGELIRSEGRGDYIGSPCVDCNDPNPRYRCGQCASGEMLCRSCIVTRHRVMPLHFIEEWTDDCFFKRASLKGLGLRIQLGHVKGSICVCPERAYDDDFVVLDLGGIHEVGVDFCGCASAPARTAQLLRYGWFPASVARPKTAATLTALKFFQLLSFESKTSVYEFYKVISRWTDNTGLKNIKDRYEALALMVRELGHLLSLKRAARGHKEGGVMGTQPGECAVLCAACPHLNINVNEKRMKLRPYVPFFIKLPRLSACGYSWLYRLFLAIDGNFKLKRRETKANEKTDPSFGPGFSYFVPTEHYDEHIKEFDGRVVQKKSTCRNFRALDEERPSGKGQKLAVKGVVAVSCARHEIKRPLSVGDLRNGERYVNVDYLVHSSLQNCNLRDIVASYDLGCQWDKNIDEREAVYPPWMKNVYSNKAFTYLVPKFHLPSHIVKCQVPYSFNYNRHVGQTDGEGPERGWSRSNAIATSTSVMGPGHRRDTLDMQWADEAWKKNIDFPRVLLKKSRTSIIEAADHRFLHNRFTLGLDPARIAEWTSELDAWELDHSKPNPFVKRFRNISQEEVRKQLKEAEEKKIEGGDVHVLHAEVNAFEFISMGLDLEAEQRELATKKKALGKEMTPDFRNELKTLSWKVESWITSVQNCYVPGLPAYRDKMCEEQRLSPEPEAYDIPLYLPSSIPKKARVHCDTRLQELEWELREAQAHDALEEIRDSLRLKTFVDFDKKNFQQGQWHMTRNRSLVATVDSRIEAARRTYDTAREALRSLATKLKKGMWWSTKYPVLANEDIRPLIDDSTPLHMRKGAERGAESEGKRKLSWIWTRLGKEDYEKASDIAQDELRIEFCKSKARVDRWEEEVELLLEEMERVKAFFDFRSAEWKALANVTSSGTTEAMREGLAAYAREQSAMFLAMREHCTHAWRFVHDFNKLQGYRIDVIPPEFSNENK